MYANVYIMPLGPGVLLWETDCLLFWGSAPLFHRFQRPKGKGEACPKWKRPADRFESVFACFLKGSLLPHHFLHCQESAHELRLEPLAQRLHEAVVANVVNETIHLNGNSCCSYADALWLIPVAMLGLGTLTLVYIRRWCRIVLTIDTFQAAKDLRESSHSRSKEAPWPCWVYWGSFCWFSDTSWSALGGSRSRRGILVFPILPSAFCRSVCRYFVHVFSSVLVWQRHDLFIYVYIYTYIYIFL